MDTKITKALKDDSISPAKENVSSVVTSLSGIIQLDKEYDYKSNYVSCLEQKYDEVFEDMDNETFSDYCYDLVCFLEKLYLCREIIMLILKLAFLQVFLLLLSASFQVS